MSTRKDNDLYLCAFGASAGGLEALSTVLNKLDKSLPVTYVVAQHLSPLHASLLPDLLQRETDLTVVSLNKETRPVAGHVYITPPNHNVIYKHGKFVLTKPNVGVGPKPCINVLFSSIATELSDRAIGIILSGTGSDGAEGCMAIKSSGGLVIVQNPQDSKYDGMPQSAIATGAVDQIVNANFIPDTIGKLFRQVESSNPSSEEQPHAIVAETLRKKSGLDVSQYKSNTIERRMRRRMALFGINNYEAYANYLNNHPCELDLLARDLLISVTQFFRDQTSFDALQSVLEKQIQAKQDREFRVWVPGCASGEEAYSICLMIEELNRTNKRPIKYQVFATDLDNVATARGRKGVYTQTVLETVPEPMKSRYFSETDGGSFEICKEIREKVIFAEHNLIENPPFSRIDLISCRNLLIYFTAELQKRVFHTFHYALIDDGILFLGKSENVQQSPSLFKPIDKPARIFRKNNAIEPIIQSTTAKSLSSNKDKSIAKLPTEKSQHKNLQTEIISKFAPAIIFVSNEDNVVFVSDSARLFLTIPSGNFGANIFELINPKIRAEIRALLHKSRRREETVHSKLSFPIGEHEKISVCVTKSEREDGHFISISFDQQSKLPTSEINIDVDLVNELEHQLSSTREHLQTVVEELETSNEELQSVNEELQSSNEELQSTNEELQTSNEELQSTNEELLTVNDELHAKSQELEIALNDIENIQHSMGYPIVLINRDLEIQRYTGPILELVDARTITEGQKLFSAVWKFDIQDTFKAIDTCIQQNTCQELRIRVGEIEYLLKISPYRNKQSAVTGAVLLFIDITDITRIEIELAQSEAQWKTLLNIQVDGVVVLDHDRNINFINARARELLKFKTTDTVPQWLEMRKPELKSLFDRCLSIAESDGAQLYHSFSIDWDTKNQTLGFRVSYLSDSQIGFPAFLIIVSDITEHELLKKQLINERQVALATINGIEDGVITVNGEGQIILCNSTASQTLSLRGESVIGKQLNQILAINAPDSDINVVDYALQHEQNIGPLLNQTIRGPQGKQRHVDVMLSSIQADTPQSVHLVVTLRDSYTRDEAVKQLSYKASHDSLTGLINRHHFDGLLAQAIMHGNQFGQKALLYIDLDQFKVVNDSCGHYAGDQLLIQISIILSELMYPQDQLARLGGDEFGVILDLSSGANLKEKVEAIINAIQDHRFEFEDKVFRIGASVGVVLLTDDIFDTSTALARADAACYLAKEKGRNCYQIHEIEHATILDNKQQLEALASLEKAIEDNELVLYVQPISPARGRFENSLHFNIELLARLKRDGNIILPGQFIPAAERYNKIHVIDFLVLKTAFHHPLLDEALNRFPELDISINISAMTISRDDFLTKFLQVAEESGFDLSRLVIEITETAAINHINSVSAALEILRGRGIKFALDDFGTGMNSFSLLKRIKVDMLKIDGSFVRDVTTDFVDSAVVEAIIKVAKEMELTTVAEFVETTEIKGALKALGVDLLQGYSIAKPMPIEEWMQKISKEKRH